MAIKYLPVYILLHFSFLSAQTSISEKELDQSIETLMNPVSEKNLFSGVIMVSQGKKIIFQKAYGYAHKSKIPNSLNTRFGIGSITKLMTGILVEQMVEEGKLELDWPVSQFIPGFPNGPKGKEPTIGHLLNHRSGVPHRVTNVVEETQFFSLEQMVDKVKEKGLLFSPGKKRLYSSAGYTVLARIIEIIEGKPFQKILAAKVFEPANMKFAQDESRNSLNENVAAPYFLGMVDQKITAVEGSGKNLSFLKGAGSVYASAEDLFNFLKTAKSGELGKNSFYNRVNGKNSSWRGWAGRTSGYEAYMDVLPSQNIALIILSNVRSSATWQIRSQLRNLLQNGSYQPVILPPALVQNKTSPKSLVGNYDNNGFEVKISLKKGKLFRGDNEFYPIDEERYYILASGTIMKFRFNKSGEAVALIQIRGEREIVMPRIP